MPKRDPMTGKPENPPAFPRGWLKKELKAAEREAAKWPREWLECRRTKPNG